MKKFRGVLLILFLVSVPSWASQYAIQLEASRVAQLEQYRSLRSFGELYTETTDKGFIRTRLGPYRSKNRALEVLDQVHMEGFKDAFITLQTDRNTTTPRSFTETEKHQYDIESFDVKTLKEWKMLSEEQRKNLVYLDGVIHVKNSDKFIPLHEAILTQE